MARRKVTLVELPAGRIPRQRGSVPPAKRAVGMYGGPRFFAPEGKLRETEIVMKTNGRRSLEKEVLRRKRQQEELLDRQPWKIKTLAAETRLRTAERRRAQRVTELERKRQQARVEAVRQRAAEQLAAFRWRRDQAKLGKEQVA